MMIKRLCAALLLCLVSLIPANAQRPTKLSYSVLKTMMDPAKQDQYTHLLVKGDITKIKSRVELLGGSFKYAAGDIASVIIPVSGIRSFSEHSWIERIEDGYGRIQLMNDSMLHHNDVLPVHAGVPPLTQSYDGEGVVVGIIDSGIDFSHPDFKDSNGKSRIKFLWDQNLPAAANTPQPYNYGQAWNNLQIDSGHASAHKDEAHFGHGTHVAGIAAGNGLALNRYEGVAPKADLIVVAADFSNSTHQRIADATNYIYTKAKALGKPCVINASLGDYYGSHDGLNLEAQMIDNLITEQNGRSFVAAAGNLGDHPFHLGYTVTSDTSFTWISYKPGDGSVYIQMWADASQFNNVKFSIGADKITPAYSFRGRIPFSKISGHLDVLLTDTLYNNGKRIGIVQSYGELIGSTYSMEFNIIPDSTQYAWRLITTGSGKFDAWNFNFISTGLPTPAQFPDIVHYKAPDLTQTMVSSFQCSPNVITVGNYINRKSHIDYKNKLYKDTLSPPQGAINTNSSRGPTRDGRIKPDIASTGNYILAASVLSREPLLIASHSHMLAQGGKHVMDGGTSSASPVVAGIAALYLQKHPNATHMEVKNAIINCAKRDQHTGTNLPDNTWGYGKADAFNTMIGCLSGFPESFEGNDIRLFASPNPSKNLTNISYHFSYLNFSTAELNVYSLLGKVIKKIPLTDNHNTIHLNTEDMPGGVYFYELSVDGKTLRTEKMVIL